MGREHVDLLTLGHNAKVYGPPMWHLPNVIGSSLYECLLVKFYQDTLARAIPSLEEMQQYMDRLIDYMHGHGDLADITNDNYFA